LRFATRRVSLKLVRDEHIQRNPIFFKNRIYFQLEKSEFFKNFWPCAGVGTRYA